MTPVQLHLQGPDADTSLLDELLRATGSALRGGAMFAWATAAGVELFLTAPEFVRFARAGSFELVVGLDAVTNESALDVMSHAADALPGLRVQALLHDQPVLFHPKCAWFETTSGFTLITGSGNLTLRGLTANWEAFTVTRLAGPAAEDREAQLSEALKALAPYLFPLDHRLVRARARENSATPDSSSLRTSWARGPAPSPAHPSPEPLGSLQDILLAEVPGRTNDRWGQANFDLDNYRAFFGAEPGTPRHLILYHVLPNGRLSPPETRPSVSVKSHNFRFELGAARGLAYPPSPDRPIVALRRYPGRVFLYRLLMPGDPHYQAIRQLLYAQAEPRPGRLQRVRLTARELADHAPDVPLLHAHPPNDAP